MKPQKSDRITNESVFLIDSFNESGLNLQE